MVVDEPEFLNICFWYDHPISQHAIKLFYFLRYVPPSMRNLDPREKLGRLEKVAPKIKARMMQRGTTMVRME